MANDMENKLEIWQKAHQLTLSVYHLSNKFPKEEQYGLTSQLKRSVSSIPANIVEGQSRQHPKEFRQFLYIAKGSLAETEYHLFLAKELNYLSIENYLELSKLILSLKMMFNKLIRSIDRLPSIVPR